MTPVLPPARDDPRRMAGRVAAVTGAGSGIGRATALVLASEGAQLVLNDIDRSSLEEATGMLTASGYRGHATVVGDISIEDTASEVTSVALREFGKLDSVVGGVGQMFFKDIDEVTVEEFDRVMAVNVRGMFLICKHTIPLLRGHPGGSIVLVTSTSAFRGQEFDGTSSFAYNVSKAAVRQLATSLATRYAADGLRVNAVAPGVVRTSQISNFATDMSAEEEDALFSGAGAATPLGRYADPSEIGRAITFLLSDDASFITGETLVVDGGLMAS